MCVLIDTQRSKKKIQKNRDQIHPRDVRLRQTSVQIFIHLFHARLETKSIEAGIYVVIPSLFRRLCGCDGGGLA